MKGEGASFDSAVGEFYSRYPEEERLARGRFRIEAERTRILISRFTPPPPAVILDVGGAAGAYAFWLASGGYDVHLLDPVDRLVEVARDRNASAPRRLMSVGVGDARRIPFSDRIADVVLMLGPLYHLTDRADRGRALREASRVLRSGGLLFVACITRWASLFDGLVHGFLADPDFARVVEADLETGQHRNPTSHPHYFTTSYFHTPEEFEGELRSSGLMLEGIFGLEGPAALLTDFEERWQDARTRAELLSAAEAVQCEPSLLGLSPHLLGVCRKPGPDLSGEAGG